MHDLWTRWISASDLVAPDAELRLEGLEDATTLLRHMRELLVMHSPTLAGVRLRKVQEVANSAWRRFFKHRLDIRGDPLAVVAALEETAVRSASRVAELERRCAAASDAERTRRGEVRGHERAARRARAEVERLRALGGYAAAPASDGGAAVAGERGRGSERGGGRVRVVSGAAAGEGAEGAGAAAGTGAAGAGRGGASSGRGGDVDAAAVAADYLSDADGTTRTTVAAVAVAAVAAAAGAWAAEGDTEEDNPPALGFDPPRTSGAGNDYLDREAATDRAEGEAPSQRRDDSAAYGHHQHRHSSPMKFPLSIGDRMMSRRPGSRAVRRVGGASASGGGRDDL